MTDEQPNESGSDYLTRNPVADLTGAMNDK